MTSTLSPLALVTISNIRAAQEKLVMMEKEYLEKGGAIPVVSEMPTTLFEAYHEVERLTAGLAGLLQLSYWEASFMVFPQYGV